MTTDVRRRIVAVTLDLIGAQGIGGLSNRSVAKAAEVSLGTLTYHFPSQEQLLSEALHAFVDEEIARLSEISAQLNGDADLSLDQFLVQARTAIEDRAGRRQQIAQLELYAHATRNADLRDAAAKCFTAYDAVAAAALSAFGIPDAQRLAPLMGALIDGLELRRLAVDDLTVDLTEGLAILVDGLRQTGSTSA